MMHLPTRHITMWREDMHANLTEVVARRRGEPDHAPPPNAQKGVAECLPPNATWQGGLSRLPRAQKAHLAFPQTLHGKVDFLGYQGPKRPTFPSYLTTLHYLIPLVRKQRACYVINQEAKDGAF